jgi:SsrA-binding protein
MHPARARGPSVWAPDRRSRCGRACPPIGRVERTWWARGGPRLSPGPGISLAAPVTVEYSRTAMGPSDAKGTRAQGEAVRTLASNRKARYDYHVEETYEAGIVLVGSEVKSVRQGRANLQDSYAAFERGELFLHHCHIGPYAQASRFNPDPLRARKLLMRREQLQRLVGKVEERGFTLVPLSLYLKGRHVKVSLALARGKKSYDRREDIKRREADREVAQASRERARMSE